MMTANVDILMPVRNGGEWLAAGLDSIRGQTFRDWRLIAVDDGSTDDTGRMLRDFAVVYPCTCLLKTGGTGLVSALNLGLEHATAPWVARMDADDIMHPQRLERQVAFLADHPDIGVVGCGVDEAGASPGFAHYLRWINGLIDPESMSVSRFVESPLVHPTACFRRSLVEAHGGYRDGDFPEDYECWLRWMEQGVKFAKVPETLFTWTDHPKRLTRTDPRYDVMAFYRIKAVYLARWLKASVPPQHSLWIWGAGAVTRRRVRPLLSQGIEVAGWIDVDPKKIGTRNQDGRVYAPEALPGPAESFVLVAVGRRGAREIIAEALTKRGYREGTSYLNMA